MMGIALGGNDTVSTALLQIRCAGSIVAALLRAGELARQHSQRRSMGAPRWWPSSCRFWISCASAPGGERGELAGLGVPRPQLPV
jgi:hypothetical protein